MTDRFAAADLLLDTIPTFTNPRSEEMNTRIARDGDAIVTYTQAQRATGDMFGWAAEALLPFVDFEHARPLLFAGTTQEDWDEQYPPDQRTAEDVRAEAMRYLEFAVGKVTDHRGLSAERSIIKLRALLWLLGLDDAIASMDAAGYTNYGAPKLKVVAEALDAPWPDDSRLARMAAGLPCGESDYECGCGR